MSLSPSRLVSAPLQSGKSRVFALLNPRSGSCLMKDVRQAIESRITTAELEIHEFVESTDSRAVVREALGRGFDTVIVAGGDGTVSMVADVLAGTSAHLIIFPLGTANVLARELGIPIELEGSSLLGASRIQEGSGLGRTHAVVEIDAMRIDGRHYFTQVGVGLDSLMIRDTTVERKRRFGRLAYLWTMVIALAGFQPRRFYLTIDGRSIEVKAAQVVVANTGMMGHPGLRWGPEIAADDAKVDVCIVKARSLVDYAGLLWHVVRGSHRKSPNIRYETARSVVTLRAKHPHPVQADGEILGLSPVTIEVVPRALRVVVPAPPESDLERSQQIPYEKERKSN